MSFDEYDKNKLKELSRRGGVNSGKVRREKRAEIENKKLELLAREEILREICTGIKDISAEVRSLKKR